jgi:hypothetical protein
VPFLQASGRMKKFQDQRQRSLLQVDEMGALQGESCGQGEPARRRDDAYNRGLRPSFQPHQEDTP